MEICYINGAFKPLREAAVSVLDRGFLFGDGVYEVIPVYGGCPFRLEGHLARLDASLAGVRMGNPHDREHWATLIQQVMSRNGESEGMLYLQVTRGVAPREHTFPAETRPTVFIMLMSRPDRSRAVRGLSAITAPDIRWAWCNIKAIALLPNVLLRQQALDTGAAEAILVRDGWVTEGAASNVFVVRQGAVVTPPKSAQLLPGITRDLVVELMEQADIPWEERLITLEELYLADELWITSSSREVVPVTELDGNPVGAGLPGPVWRRADDLFQEFKERVRQEC